METSNMERRPVGLNDGDLVQNNLQYLEKLEFDQPIQEPNNYVPGQGNPLQFPIGAD